MEKNLCVISSFQVSNDVRHTIYHINIQMTSYHINQNPCFTYYTHNVKICIRTSSLIIRPVHHFIYTGQIFLLLVPPLIGLNLWFFYEPIFNLETSPRYCSGLNLVTTAERRGALRSTGDRLCSAYLTYSHKEEKTRERDKTGDKTRPRQETRHKTAARAAKAKARSRMTSYHIQYSNGVTPY
jgi:hypothetical protein